MKTRMLGLENLEKMQKEDQKTRSAEKKAEDGKEEVKVEEKAEKEAPRVIVVKPRGKKHKASLAKVDKSKSYTVEEAVVLMKKAKWAAFDESVEIHMNVDKTGIKGEVDLPHSIGKTTRVVILDDKVLDDLAAGKIEFDVLVTHPSFMPKLAKFAKILGPKGLMPNPKAGTISPKPEEVVKKFAKGMLRWKTEPKFPLVHQLLGKLSYEDAKIVENVKAFVAAVGKPHITGAFLKSTMGPSVKIDLEKV